MLCGGDEISRTQLGNNNAYCQDNEISWYDWDLDERERSLLQAADELHRDQSITDATWSALVAQHDRAALVELLYVVGQYTMLSMVANAIKG